MSAIDALQMNLVSRVLDPQNLDEEVQKLALKISGRGPLAIALAKRSLNMAVDQDVDSALRTEAKNFGELFNYADTREGLKAFIEKRKPTFQAK